MQRKIIAVDSHTQGEPTRVVTGGIPHIPGENMVAKRIYLMENMDELRKSIMLEPRGHRDMFGSILTSPTDPRAHLGIIFMDTGGYLNMCGHGTIGAVTVALETGIIKAEYPVTNVILEAPAGLIHCRAEIEKDKVTKVSFTNVPAFLYKENIPIELPFKVFEKAISKTTAFNKSTNEKGLVKIYIDIAFGGSFFAIVDTLKYGIALEPDNASEIIDLGAKLKNYINSQIEVSHPTLHHINTVDLVEFSQKPLFPGDHYKNAVVFGKKQLDRSPCGTGTCAKMAVLHQRGILKVGEEFIHDSIINTRFFGKIISLTEVGNFPAVVPEISSSAYITGINQLIIDDRDPLAHGFLLG